MCCNDVTLSETNPLKYQFAAGQAQRNHKMFADVQVKYSSVAKTASHIDMASSEKKVMSGVTT